MHILFFLVQKSPYYVHPPYWQKSVWELDEISVDDNGYHNEDLIVWMRTAALPTFKKLHRRINHTGIFKNSLPAGLYTITIDYSILSDLLLFFFLFVFILDVVMDSVKTK